MKKLLVLLGVFVVTVQVQAQALLGGQVTGNFQIDAQVSKQDSSIGAEDVPQKLLSNVFANLLYTNGGFSAGIRFESYLDPLLGFNSQYKGAGIANKFMSYQNEMIDITAGNFYEQYGSGLIFRSYEDRNLGLDNAMMGVNVKVRPIDGILLKAMVGKQRYYWDYGKGLVRGIDGEFALNSLIKGFEESKTRVTLGAGFVSRYEDDQTILANDEYKLNLPLNVGAGSFRMDLAHGNWGLQAEYAMKSQDPNVLNNYIYKWGDALFVSASYSKKGLGINLQAKRIDNMGFKSERTATGEMLYINYIPAMSKQHTYALMALYPAITQVNGEMGIQADVTYTIKKGTLLGGKYGTTLKLNYSQIMSIDKQALNDSTSIGQKGTDGYTSDFFKVGDELYYQDFNMEISKKLSSKSKLNLTYAYIAFNPVMENEQGDIHYNNVVVADYTYKLNNKNVIRGELQWLKSNIEYFDEDKRSGDWLMALVEWNFTSAFFVSVSDQYNYNGSKNHYYNVSVGYTHNTTRFQLGYGKQRKGLLCIGGVCREVPASNGLTFSLTSSF
ncbi:MAG: hypothetical protein IKY22_09600 [Bacteroidales bacterium]|nr:hypothetical protein [Bacteroidales bacterium]